MSTERVGETADGTDTGAGNSYLGDLWVNYKRWNLKAIRNPFIITGTLLQPVIFFVLFTQVFGGIATNAIGGGAGGGISYETYLVPAIAVQVSLAAAASSGIGLVNDIENGMFNKVLVTPMSRSAVFLGKSLAEITRIVVQIGIILVLGWLLGASYQTGIFGLLGIIVVGIVFSLWFTAFSNVVALITRDQESTIIGANILQFPMLFVSSAFLPLERLPGWIQTVATFNPVTYGVDAARSFTLGRDTMTVIDVHAFGGIWNAVVPAVVILLVLDLVLGGVAVYMLNRAASAAVE
ncbi:MAG: ABC transporter permease [Haloarculaceae archaeon]